jgi:hypothetical protein
MDESFICECGNDKFWFYWGTVRCTKCWNEYKKTVESIDHGDGDGVILEEYWLRRFNLKENKYNPNWEKSKLTYKNV